MLDERAKSKLLAAAADSPSLAAACRRCGVPRSAAAAAMRDDAEFGRSVEDALARAVGLAEETLFERAVEGWEEPVFYRGERVPLRDPETGAVLRDHETGEPRYHTTRQVDNSLLQVYLRAAEPDRYGTARPGPAESPAQPQGPQLEFGALTDGELAELERLLAKATPK